MADIWTPPRTWVAATLLASELNTDIRDNETVLQLGLHGDGSTQSEGIHRHKSGAAGSAPPAVSSSPLHAGRIYGPDGQILIQTNAGDAWYGIGPGPWDDFWDARRGTSTITPARSGHPWTEESGNLEVTAAGELRPVSGTAYGSLETYSDLDRAHRITATFGFGTGANDIGIITKFVDTNNFLFVQLTKTALNLFSRIAGVETNRGGTTFSGADGQIYRMELISLRNLLSVTAWQINATDRHVTSHENRHDDFNHVNLAGATKVGVRGIGAIADCRGIAVDFG